MCGDNIGKVVGGKSEAQARKPRHPLTSRARGGDFGLRDESPIGQSYKRSLEQDFLALRLRCSTFNVQRSTFVHLRSSMTVSRFSQARHWHDDSQQQSTPSSGQPSPENSN